MASGIAQIALWSTRTTAKRIFCDTLRQAGKPVLVFGRETPREMLKPLVNRGGDETLVPNLILATELACFGRVDPSVDEIQSLHSLATTVRSVWGQDT